MKYHHAFRKLFPSRAQPPRSSLLSHRCCLLGHHSTIQTGGVGLQLERQQESLLLSARSFSSTGISIRRRRELIVGGTHEITDLTPDYCLKPPSPYNTALEVEFSSMEEPYDHGLPTFDEYLKKASLSPWVPTPDVVARKMMDVAQAGPDDVHVDLGSGDGRVCFHALDVGVARSTGIDVDEAIVAKARERLRRRHPPPALEFIVADLLDLNHPAWQKVQEATFITMFFAEEGLRAFRPALERKLAGCKCKIITCGYEMPGWNSRAQEIVLGTQIHRYDWGSEEEDSFDQFIGEDIVEQVQRAMLRTPSETNNVPGYKVTNRTYKNADGGYSPEALAYYDDDDDDDDDADDDEEEKSENKTNK